MTRRKPTSQRKAARRIQETTGRPYMACLAQAEAEARAAEQAPDRNSAEERIARFMAAEDWLEDPEDNAWWDSRLPEFRMQYRASARIVIAIAHGETKQPPSRRKRAAPERKDEEAQTPRPHHEP